MKIYNKMQFLSGIFMVVLGVINLIADIVADNVEIKGVILVAALFLFGFDAFRHSLSKKLSIEDKLDKLDERNQLIELKSRNMSFKLTQGISFGLMVGALVAGKLSGKEILIGIALGLGFAYTISMYSEIFTYMYYDHRN